MRYEVIADRLFFLHFGMNVLLLVLTAKLGGMRMAWKRLVAAAALGSLFFVGVLLWPMGNMGAVRVRKASLMAFGTLAVLYFSFGTSGSGGCEKRGAAAKHAVQSVLEAAMLYAVSACGLGGVLTAIVGLCGGQQKEGRQSGDSMLHILIPTGIAAAVGVWMIERARKRRKDPLWQAELRAGDKCIQVTALLDSGNSLWDPMSKRPVCIVEKEILEQLGLLERPENFRLIPYHSIGKRNGLLRAAVLEEMCLQKGGQKQKKRRVLLAASDQALSGSGRYRMLLHPALLEGDLPEGDLPEGDLPEGDLPEGDL